jgi:hypothetical protein
MRPFGSRSTTGSRSMSESGRKLIPCDRAEPGDAEQTTAIEREVGGNEGGEDGLETFAEHDGG